MENGRRQGWPAGGGDGGSSGSNTYASDLGQRLGLYEYNGGSFPGASDKNSNCSKEGSSASRFLTSTPGGFGGHLANDLRPMSEHYYEQPMVVFPQASRVRPPADSGDVDEGTPFALDGGGSTSSSSAASRGSPSLPIPLDPRLPSMPPTNLRLPRLADPHCIGWASVGEAGGRLAPPRSPEVSLTVPAGAVGPAPKRQDLFVAVLLDERYRPRLEGGRRAPVTPVVQCGPASAGLDKPVVLSLPHVVGYSGCGSSDNLRSKLTVLYCQDLDSEGAEWEVASSPNNSDSNGIFLQVDPASAHLVTERLGAFVLVADVAELRSEARIAAGKTAASSVGGSSSSGFSSAASSQQPSPEAEECRPILAASTRRDLGRVLDAPSLDGAGWRQLADALGASSFLSFLSAQSSPSEALLTLWEAREAADASAKGHAGDSLRRLASALRSVGREDALVVLDREMIRAA